jgi:hypothetical protein
MNSCTCEKKQRTSEDYNSKCQYCTKNTNYQDLIECLKCECLIAYLWEVQRLYVSLNGPKM